jgi:hypothetical protein
MRLTLTMVSAIYWQASKVNRVILEYDLMGDGADLSLL